MAADISPVYAPWACSETFCAPQAIALPRNFSPTCARYANGGHTAQPEPGDCLSSASSSAAIEARLPCIFQLPATSRLRFIQRAILLLNQRDNAAGGPDSGLRRGRARRAARAPHGLVPKWNRK